MTTTGNAGGSHNLVVAHGDDDLPALLRRMGRGLFVTEQLGQGVNPVTGDYSRGAAGFWVEGRRDRVSRRGDHDRRQPQGHLPRHRRDRPRCRSPRLAPHRIHPGRTDDRGGPMTPGRATPRSLAVDCDRAGPHAGSVVQGPASATPRRRRSGSTGCRRPTRWRSRRKRWSSSRISRDARSIAGPAQVEALLRIDARLEPILRQLAQQYTTNYQKSTERRDAPVARGLRPRQGVRGRLCSARCGRAIRAPTTSAGATSCRGSSSASSTTKGIDGKFRLFRYGHWIPAQWREFHELYEFARMRGWQREQLVLGAGMFAQPGVCVEQEYLKALLLMRLDSGNFTPDQVEWVARQLEGWASPLTAERAAGTGDELRRRSRELAGNAPPGQVACGRPCPVARRRSRLRAGRRAHALAAGARRRHAEARTICLRASSGCC